MGQCFIAVYINQVYLSFRTEPLSQHIHLTGSNFYSTLCNLTFIGHLEAQGATGVICFEIEPHLVTGADYKVWSGGTRQAEMRQEDTFLKHKYLH